GKGHYNWEKALKAGMAATGVPYSGKMGFVKTEMSWPITHMVAPKEDALSCAQCHKENGRLSKVSGIYQPGTGSMPILDMLGSIVAWLTLLGVIIHGGIRVIQSRKGA
ncbi:MAG: cytochrome C, partial [Gammaproteobacteria bacterium]|nr:cytochrome C [Gammaproteobacteria bacterium]